MNSFLPAAIKLYDLALVDVSGPDAALFLQGQLTQDVSGASACLAGYCSPKGRLLASMIVWHEPGAATPVFHILIKQSIAENFTRRMTKFVMRAKVTIRIAQAQVFGVTLPAANSASENAARPAISDDTSTCCASVANIAEAAGALPATPQPYDMRQTELGTWIAAPSAAREPQRWWLVVQGAAQNQDAADDDSRANTGSAQAESAWQVQDIAAGLGWVVAGIEEMFIPQTLNMDITGGVSFNKGCYPGQEIVARSHYRGTIKRRMAYGVAPCTNEQGQATEHTGLPGADIFNANKPDAPCGRVINAASTDQTHLLFEAALADLDSADFRLAGPHGPAIRIAGLPYRIEAA